MFYFFCQKISYIFLTVFRIFKYLLSDRKRYANLLFIILAHKPKSIVEVGIYRGTRSKEMIKAAKIFNKDIEFYGFDFLK